MTSLAAIAAQRANAAYITNADDSKAAFLALGDTWIAMYQNDSHQAVMSTNLSGYSYLSISGTRSPLSMDLFDDVSLDSVKVQGGKVTSGAYEGMDSLWNWALSTAPRGTMFSVCGHSLGGSRTHLTPLFLPDARIGPMFSFEAPKFCDAAYYETYNNELSGMRCFLNGKDLWASWPWDNPDWNARPLVDHIWLKDDYGQYELIPGDKWPGGVDAADHDMSMVAKRVAMLDNTLFKGKL